MPVKIHVGLSKKIGQQNFGSLGASCHIEFELDSGFDNGSTERFQDATRRAYAACRQAVESQIAMNGKTENRQRVGLQHIAEPVNRIVNRVEAPAQQSRESRMATPAQLRAIRAIVKHNRIDLDGAMASCCSVRSLNQLTIRSASKLIDHLKRSIADKTD